MNHDFPPSNRADASKTRADAQAQGEARSARASWGMASLCFALQAASQCAVGLGAWGSAGSPNGLPTAMWMLAFTSLLCAIIHKGRTFEEVRARSPSGFRMPWPARFSQMGFGLAMMAVSAIAISESMLSPVHAGWVAYALAACAVWAASQSRES